MYKQRLSWQTNQAVALKIVNVLLDVATIKGTLMQV